MNAPLDHNSTIAGASPLHAKYMRDRLWVAYTDNAHTPALVKRSAYDAAARELPHTFAQFPELDRFVTTQEMPLVNHVLRDALLLYSSAEASSANKGRKYSAEKSYIHSMRVAELALGIIKNVITAPTHLADVILKSFGHDLIEDFKTTREQIAQHSGQNIADSVWAMTTPSTKHLVSKYPAVAGKYINAEKFGLTDDEFLKKQPAEYVDALEVKDRVDYLDMKAQLKLQFKCDEAREFTLDELIIKAVDNIDAISSYIRDFKSGNIKLYPTDNIGAPIDKRGNITLYPTALAKKNIDDRINYHYNAIYPRLHALKKQNANGIGEENYVILFDRLNKLFHDEKLAFGLQIDKAIAKTRLINASYELLLARPARAVVSGARNLWKNGGSKLSRGTALML